MTDQFFEIVIIGAGPAGLGAATSAAHHGLSHLLIEKAEIGNTIYNYQLRKHVMAEPGRLPLRAHVPFEAGTRENVLASWEKALKEKKANIVKGDVTKISKTNTGFEVEYSGNKVGCKYVILAIGVQGTPRTLGVPGEELPHVAYTLSDPDAFNGKDITVVGAGDAAIENALALMEHNRVSILNRSGEFARAKDANNALITGAISAGKITCFYNAAVASITSDKITIDTADGQVTVKCDHIIARLGCILPRKFLEGCGIKFPSADPSSVPAVNHRYESNVPGLFILGALIGYPLIKQAINQGYEVIEHILGNPIEPADQVLIAEKLAPISGETNENLKRIRDSLPLFKDLTEPQFREFILDSNIHKKASGETIFTINDYTDTFFSVVSGSVSVDLPSGKKVELKAGNFFGEMGLLSGRRRNATVTAVTESVLIETNRRQVLKLISSVESVKKQLDEVFLLRALQTSIFPEADPKLFASLTPKVRFKQFKKGDVIFREGDAGDAFYVIRKGSVKISKIGPSGQNVTINYVAAGNYFGEMALLSKDERRTATVSAAVPCETILIDKSDFVALLGDNPQIRSRINMIVESRRLEALTKKPDLEAAQLLDFVVGQGITDAENVLLIDSDRCIACDNCEKACAATHNGHSRLDRKGGKSFASLQIPISCRHCENPLCMLDCPPDALTRKPNGEVVIRDSCIGCGNCARNCPYGVIQIVHESPSSGFSLWGLFGSKHTDEGPAKAAKCDMCSEMNGGPACVRACPTGAAMRVNPSQLFDIVGKV